MKNNTKQTIKIVVEEEINIIILKKITYQFIIVLIYT